MGRYVDRVKTADQSDQQDQRRGQWWRLPVMGRVLGVIRPYRQGDRALVLRDLAPVLAAAYPGGDHWLARRLDDVAAGAAKCDMVCTGNHLAAIAIETPKGERKIKLSTLWVADAVRGRGLGARLLDHCRRSW